MTWFPHRAEATVTRQKALPDSPDPETPSQLPVGTGSQGGTYLFSGIQGTYLPTR